MTAPKPRWSDVSEHPPKMYKIIPNADGSFSRQQVVYVDNDPDRRMLVLFPGSAEGANKDSSADNFLQSVNKLIDHYGIDMSKTDVYTCSYYHPYPKERTQENIDGLVANPIGYVSEDALVLARSLLPLIVDEPGYDRSRFYGHKLPVQQVKENISRLTCIGKSKGSLIATREIFHALNHLMKKEYGYTQAEIDQIRPEYFGIGVANLFVANMDEKRGYGIVFTDTNDTKAKKYHPDFEPLIANASTTDGIKVSYVSRNRTAICVTTTPHELTLASEQGHQKEPFSDPSGHKVKSYLGLRYDEAQNHVPRAFSKALRFGIERAPGELEREGLPAIMKKHIVGRFNKKVELPHVRPHALLWVESLVGNGHLNYAGEVARELASKGYDVTMASGSRKDKSPNMQIPGVTMVDLPGVTGNYAQGTIHTENGHSIRSDKPWREAYQAKVEQVIKDAEPDVVITEFWPIRRGDFDFAMKAFTDYKEKRPQTKLFSLVRDYAPMSVEVERHNGDDNKATRIIDKHYDGVLVHSVKSILPLKQSFNGADAIEDKTHYLGYIVRHEGEKKGPHKPRDKVLVTCGGGWMDYCPKTYDAIVKALPDTPYRNDEIHILVPDIAPAEYRKHLEAEVAALNLPNIRVEGYRSDFSSLLRESKAIFCHGGNTIVEAIDAGIKDIYVTPRMNPGEINLAFTEKGAQFHVPEHVKKEQLVRAAVFANSGYINLIRPEELHDMANKVNDYAQKTRWVAAIASRDLCMGAQKAADIVDHSLHPEKRQDRPYDG